MISVNAFKYVVSRFFDITGIINQYEILDDYCIKIDDIIIHFFVMDDTEAKKLRNGSAEKKTYVTNSTKNSIIFFKRSDVSAKDVEKKGETIWINVDIITISFLLLSRVEEIDQPKDRYNRFSYSNSLAKKYEFIDYPIVDEYAYWFKDVLNQYIQIECEIRYPQLLLTHDVDSIKRFGGKCNVIKSILGGDLLLRKDIQIFFDSLKHYYQIKKGKRYDPEIEGLYSLLEISSKYELQSEFYFMGIDKDSRGNEYCLEKLPQDLFNRIGEINGKCGFHGGIGTSEDKEMFKSEKIKVEKAFGNCKIDRGRQHYLMFDAKQTPCILQSQGMKYDSTLGFFDREGFMCGTCHEFPMYDVIHDCETNVIERPLLVMDCTLKDYRGLSKREAINSMYTIYENVCRVNGQMVILWHNGCTYREWEDWFKEVYCVFIERVCNKRK